MLITGLFIGGIFGFVLQRGRFCITGAFRDVWVSKNSWWLAALFVAITVQAVGIALLDLLGILPISTAVSPFAPFATVIGGFIFGFGILMAGGCATGTYYRAGEGLVGSWFALIFYMLFAAIFKYGPFAQITSAVRAWGVTENATVYQSLGISVWALIAVLALVTAWWVHRHLTRSKLPMATLPPEKTGIAHLFFEKAWNPYVTAVLVGLIAIAAWPLSWATGREGGLGITTPSAKIVNFLGTGDIEMIDWGVFLVLGILLGSFIAAKASGEFKMRVPDSKTLIRSIIGGALMGWGAAWAGGCSIGNGLVETSMFSWQGWVSLLAMIAGTGLSARIFIMPKHASRAVPA